MSTDADKLQALHNTVAEILRGPSSPPSFFDEEPYDAAKFSEQVARASDNLRRGTEIPKEHFGKATSGETGISPKEIHEAHIVRDAKNDSPGIVRQALAAQTPAEAPANARNQQFSRLSHDAASPRSDPRTANINTFGRAVSGNRGGWALGGFAGILLAAGIGIVGVIWWGSSGDAAKTGPSQPAPLVQTAPSAAASPGLTPLLQAMARDLASMGKEIEQLKAGRDLTARDNVNLGEQLKASQEQLTRTVARLSEQLKASQEQATRDNANVAEQVRGIREQLTSITSRAFEPNAPPKIAAASPRPTLPSSRPAVPAERKPGPILLSPQATTQPKAEKPKLSSTSRPPPPAR